MNGFISYSHDDFDMFEEFLVHAKSIERSLGVTFWSDPRISPGYYWNATIENAINIADVFILLTSPDFIASDYIYDKEIPAIKARHKKAGALVLPLVLKRCAWQMVADSLQAVPTHNGRLRPVSDWRRHSDGFDHARIQIGEVVEKHFGLSVKSVGWNGP
jgi:hypothetical protein